MLGTTFLTRGLCLCPPRLSTFELEEPTARRLLANSNSLSIQCASLHELAPKMISVGR